MATAQELKRWQPSKDFVVFGVTGGTSGTSGMSETSPGPQQAIKLTGELWGRRHPDYALALNNLAMVHRAMGNYRAALPLLQQALQLTDDTLGRRHPDFALGLNNLAALYRDQGKLGDAEPLFKDALEMSRRLIILYAKQKAEGESLNLRASLPLYRDSVLSIARQRTLTPKSTYDPATTYPALWAAKGTIARVYEQRQQQAP